MKNKLFKMGVVKGEQVPQEVRELGEELEKLPETIAEEISQVFQEDSGKDGSKEE